jgi:hypothetical protein
MISKKHMATKQITKKKPMTLEDFAAAVHKDYLEIRKDMATTNDLWPLQRDIKTLDKNVRELRSDITIITETMVSKADLASTLGEELEKSQYARHINDLQARVNVLEQKAGIKSTRRAA